MEVRFTGIRPGMLIEQYINIDTTAIEDIKSIPQPQVKDKNFAAKKKALDALDGLNNIETPQDQLSFLISHINKGDLKAIVDRLVNGVQTLPATETIALLKEIVKAPQLVKLDSINIAALVQLSVNIQGPVETVEFLKTLIKLDCNCKQVNLTFVLDNLNKRVNVEANQGTSTTDIETMGFCVLDAMETIILVGRVDSILPKGGHKTNTKTSPASIMRDILKLSQNFPTQKKIAFEIGLIYAERALGFLKATKFESQAYDVLISFDLVEQLVLIQNSILDKQLDRTYLDLKSIIRYMKIVTQISDPEHYRYTTKQLLQAIRNRHPGHKSKSELQEMIKPVVSWVQIKKSDSKSEGEKAYPYSLAISDLQTLKGLVENGSTDLSMPVYLELLVLGAIQETEFSVLEPIVNPSLLMQQKASSFVVGSLEYTLIKNVLMQRPYAEVKDYVDKITSASIVRSKNDDISKFLGSKNKISPLANTLFNPLVDNSSTNNPEELETFKKYIHPVLDQGLELGSIPAVVGFLGDAVKQKMQQLIQCLVTSHFNNAFSTAGPDLYRHILHA